MSEDVPEYNKKELKFVRLKNTYDDLIGYVTYGTEHIVIEMPLRIEIETLFEEGRQILSLQEYLPQSVVTIREIEISMNEIMFVTPVREEFNEQYEYVSDFFYNNESKLKKPKATIPKRESITETTEKVVSILEAMVNKKDKPVH